MTAIQSGTWVIHSVCINGTKQPAQRMGFKKLIVEPDQLRLEPAGISFNVRRTEASGEVLESRSQLFSVSASERSGKLSLHLTRPTFGDTIDIEADRS